MIGILQRTGRSFREIYETYLTTVYRVAYSYMKNQYDSEDAVQETFFRLMRQTKPMKDEAHLKGWLIVTVSNVCRDMLRRRAREPLALELYTEPAEEPPQIDELMEAILRLPEKYKTAVYLYYYEGYSVKEIAELLDSVPNTVKSWLKRAREQLRELLEEDYDEE